jgi:hypothetical protein
VTPAVGARARVAVCLTAVVFGGCSWLLTSEDEVARVAAPSGDVEAVLVETNGGATTSFGYGVYVVERRDRPGSSDEVAAFYGAHRNASAYGVNLRWDSNDTLAIEYLDAKSDKLLKPVVRVARRPIAVLLRSGVEDEDAPGGGMLFNLREGERR